ncbi:SET domain-containing protein 4 [Episyrphus balteatus]|uniref:SET domain-containing protein 4 n=1 Tax=Episyrphus balteatus TaxID=286459 RepID=UPI0024855904|nr:SET domain-containing protein 4 [Episyrphus balteatus]
MGKTKRNQQKNPNESIPDKNDSAISLYHYLNKFNWKNEKKLACQNFSTTGRGLCSKTNILPGDVIIRLPLEAMITLATLENDQNFRELNEELVNSKTTISFQSLLTLYILMQKHATDSPFELYIKSIPSKFSTPYFCSSNELYFLPEIVLQQSVEQNKKIRESYKALQDAFGDKTCPCCGLAYFKEVFKPEDFKWAYFAVNSRSVFVNNYEIQPLVKSTPWCKNILSDKPEMALAPFLDLFNHSDTASTEPQIEKEGNQSVYQLTTKNTYEPYEQIFISYGNLTNLKLFTEYGFSLENNLNDYFEITLNDIEALIRTERKGFFVHSNKFKFIRDHNLNDTMFIHANDGLSHNLQVVLYLIFKEGSHFPNVLNQTAFGSTVVFEESIGDEAKALCLFKIKEYQGFVDGLMKLNELSCSGEAAVVFLKHSITYLQTYLDKFV